MLSDGRIVLGGVTSYNNEPSTAGVVLTADGDIHLNLSTAISPMTIDQRQADILIEPNGDIVMSGGFQVLDSNNTAVSRFIARFNGSTGQLDSTLIGNLGSTAITSTAYALARQSDGRLIVGGPTNVNGTNWPRIGRLAVDGGVDTSAPTFATNAAGQLDGFTFDIAVRSDNRVWVGGGFTGGVRLFDADGTPITMGTTNNSVRTVLNRPGDTVLLGGEFTTFTPPASAPSAANRLVALNADGTPDTVFNNNMGTGANGTVWSLSVQADGKILVAGEFTDFDGVTVDGVARLNADGTPDTAFNTSVGSQEIFGQFHTRVIHIGVQPDGRIILFGDITPTDPVHGALAPGLARLSADGVLDHRFNADCVNVSVVLPPGIGGLVTQPVPVPTPTPTTTIATTTTTTIPATTTTGVITNDDLPDANALADAIPTDLGAPQTVTVGSTITLTGTGFTPQENVVVLLASQRRVVSQVKADSTGTATATFTADAHLSGDQTVVMWEPATGTMKAQTITVMAGSLPATGSTNWAPWSLLIMAMGALILGVRRYAV